MTYQDTKVRQQALTGYNEIRMHSFTSESLPAALSQMARFIESEDARVQNIPGVPPFEWHFVHSMDNNFHDLYLYQQW